MDLLRLGALGRSRRLRGWRWWCLVCSRGLLGLGNQEALAKICGRRICRRLEELELPCLLLVTLLLARPLRRLCRASPFCRRRNLRRGLLWCGRLWLAGDRLLTWRDLERPGQRLRRGRRLPGRRSLRIRIFGGGFSCRVDTSLDRFGLGR